MKLKNVIYRISKSKQWKTFLMFLPFLCVSFIFWTVMTLNEDVQRSYKLPIKITNIPDSITIISPIPQTINVSVKAKGSQLIEYSWSDVPEFKIDFSVFGKRNHLSLSQEQVRIIAQELFGTTVQIQTIVPDSVNLLYTGSKGIKKRLSLDVNIEPATGFVCHQPIFCDNNEVMLFSVDHNFATNIPEIYTEQISLTDVSSTQELKVKVIAPLNMRVVPDSVMIKIPIEPLISKSEKLQIQVINVPQNYKLTAYPDILSIQLLVPMSEYDEPTPINAIVDYNERTENNKIPIRLTNIPNYTELGKVTLLTDSVECIIEYQP